MSHTIHASNAVLTYKELARHLRVTERHLRNLVRAGEIPSFTIGRNRRFRLEDVMASLAGQ